MSDVCAGWGERGEKRKSEVPAADPPVSGCAFLARARKACLAALLLAVTSTPNTSYALGGLASVAPPSLFFFASFAPFVAPPDAPAAEATTLLRPCPPPPTPLLPLPLATPSSRRRRCWYRRLHCEWTKQSVPSLPVTLKADDVDEDDVAPRAALVAFVAAATTPRREADGAAATAGMSSGVSALRMHPGGGVQGSGCWVGARQSVRRAKGSTLPFHTANPILVELYLYKYK